MHMMKTMMLMQLNGKEDTHAIPHEEKNTNKSTNKKEQNGNTKHHIHKKAYYFNFPLSISWRHFFGREVEKAGPNQFQNTLNKFPRQNEFFAHKK